MSRIDKRKGPLMIGRLKKNFQFQRVYRQGRSLSTKNTILFFKKNGEFEDTIMLIPGLNNIEFKAKNILNHQTLIWRQVIYVPDNNFSEK